MDILIKNMEMPSCCGSCPFLYSHYGNMGCRFVGRVEEIFSPNRPKDCPLVSIPEHGDLIDRDSLVARFQHHTSNPTGYDVVSKIFDAEVVLERTT